MIGVTSPSPDAVQAVEVATEVTTAVAELAEPNSAEDEDKASILVSLTPLRETAFASPLPPVMADSGV